MKPDLRIFQLAASRLGVEPIECFYVGDGADDELDGARAVGMDAILLRPGDTSPPPGWPGPEVSSLSEVPAFIELASGR